MTPLDPHTLRDLLARSAHLHPQQIALAIVDGPEITYAALHDRVQEIAHFLHERGVIAGDRVALLGENMPHWGIAYFAITAIGAVAVPILPDFHPTEIRHIVRHAECKAIFVSSRLYAKVEEMDEDTPPTMVLLDDFSVIPPQLNRGALKELLEQGEREFAKLKEAALRLARRIPKEVSPDDLAAIVYTSGTTGHSKGVMLTHRNLVSDAIATARIASVSHTDRLLSILPLSHTFECTLGLITPLLIGGSVYYMDKPPSAGVLLPALARVRPTVMLSVPLVIEKIYKGRVLPQLHRTALLRLFHRVPMVRRQLHRIAGKKLLATFGGHLRIFAIGGASLAPDVELFLREARFPYTIGYGLTETSPLVAGTGPENTRYRSTGPPIPGTEIRIADPDPVTGEGEIQIKGPTVMKGYYRDPGRTKDAFTADGWFRSGDLGVFDADGYLYIKGRSKNMILGPSGKNIYPEEIESIINEFDVVLESLVYQQGTRLVARIHPDYERLDRDFAALSDSDIRERMKIVLEDLRKEINARVSSSAKIQAIVEQTEPFEKTPTQKIKRHLYVP